MGSIYLSEDSDDSIIVKIGEKAPDFTLSDENGEEWRLSDHLGQVTAILFYPKSETVVCTKQLCSVRDNWIEYLDTKANVIGVSPETVEEHLAFAKQYRLPLPLLADSDRKVTKIFSKHWLFPVSFTRGIVVIDAKGFVRTRKIMLRAFRPTDRSVLIAIHSARADALYDNYDLIVKSSQSN